MVSLWELNHYTIIGSAIIIIIYSKLLKFPNLFSSRNSRKLKLRKNYLPDLYQYKKYEINYKKIIIGKQNKRTTVAMCVAPSKLGVFNFLKSLDTKAGVNAIVGPQ